MKFLHRLPWWAFAALFCACIALPLTTAQAEEVDDGQNLVPQLLAPQTLEARVPTRARAEELEALAWMSRLAYCINRQPDRYLTNLSANEADLKKHEGKCADWAQESRAALDGWTRVFDHADYALRSPEHGRLIAASNLVFVVYARRVTGQRAGTLVIAFRGTTMTGPDWRSNSRWLTGALPGHDHYSVLATVQQELLQVARADAASALQLQPAQLALVTTGHSLGGGLAQRLAYSHADSASVVFNTSPVTAYHAMDWAAPVNCAVPITRVEETGEVLQLVREAIRPFYEREPNIERLPFNFTRPSQVFASHGIHYLARGFTAMVDAPATPGDAGQTPAQARLDAAAFNFAFRRHEASPAVDCACYHQRKSVPLTELAQRWPRCEAYVERQHRHDTAYLN